MALVLTYNNKLLVREFFLLRRSVSGWGLIKCFKERLEFFWEEVAYYSLNVISLSLNINKGSFIAFIIYKDDFWCMSLIYT